MKKKIAVIAAALFVFASVEAFSFGLGLRGNFGWGDIYGGGILFSPNSQAHFGGNYYAGENRFSLGLTADYWLIDTPLTSVGSGSLNFYAGPGAYFRIAIVKEGDGDVGLGLRVPVGLDLDFGIVDIFLEFAPQIGVGFLPTIGLHGDWFNAAIGIRVWIGE
jgi:hypothetical protein